MLCRWPPWPSLLVIGVELIRGGQTQTDATWSKPESSSVWDCLIAISSTTFAYQGQSMLLEIAHEMENAPRDFGKAITASCGGLLALYSMATGLGYYYRGARVAGFLPDDLEDNASKTLVGLMLYFHVAVTYLVNNQPLSKKLYRVAMGRPRQEPGRRPALVFHYDGAAGVVLRGRERDPWFSAFQA